MTFPTFTSSERPTLPPLHTLDLPTLVQRPRMSMNSGYDLERPSLCHKPRQSSISSDCTFLSSLGSRTPSPTPSTVSVSVSPPSSSKPFNARYRLVPSTMAEATAFVVIPPPNTPVLPPLYDSPNVIIPQQQQHALLLVGRSIEHIRNPQRQIAKGARVHPYKIVPVDERRRHL